MQVLLTGATGFVGRALRPHLEAKGHDIVAASRRPPEEAPGWVRLDLDIPATLEPALAGCDAAIYLVHAMAEGDGYTEREAAAAFAFRSAAEAVGLRRIVYLGGVDPAGSPSEHLESRIETGRILRAGSVTTVELRAAMVTGAGSTSWQMVSDLARRLPVLPCPPWIHRGSWPVYIEDICVALTAALEMDTPSRWFDAPGAERVSHGDMIQRVAQAMGRSLPALPLPEIPAALSAFGLGLFTAADLVVAKELLHGLETDLDPTGPLIWDEMSSYRPHGVDAMIARCLEGR
ncbi:MAG: NAD-dependent epimerase/dehydratase family protein [Myxococcota bacterium]